MLGETLLSIIPKIPHKRVILTLILIASYLSATVPTDIYFKVARRINLIKEFDVEKKYFLVLKIS